MITNKGVKACPADTFFYLKLSITKKDIQLSISFFYMRTLVMVRDSNSHD